MRPAFKPAVLMPCRRNLHPTGDAAGNAASNLSRNANSMRMRLCAFVRGFGRCAATRFSAIRCEDDNLHIYLKEKKLKA